METELQSLDAYLIDAMPPYAEYWHFLQTLPGLDQISSALILVEIGTDLSAFDTVRHFASWAALCPGNHESAGKRKSGKTRKGNCPSSAISSVKPPMPLDEPTVPSVAFTKAWCRATVTSCAIASPSPIRCVLPIYILFTRRQAYHDSGIDYQAIVVNRNAPRGRFRL
ncbi:MAG: transposase [Methylococcales bacterium]